MHVLAALATLMKPPTPLTIYHTTKHNNHIGVFIHDPRIKGPTRAWLYATPGSSAARHSAKNSPLFWPDLPQPQPGEETDALFTASIECV